MKKSAQQHVDVINHWFKVFAWWQSLDPIGRGKIFDDSEEMIFRRREYRKKYAAMNKEKLRGYRQKNKDKIKAHNDKWRKANRDKVRESRLRYYYKNREKLLQYMKNRRRKGKGATTARMVFTKDCFAE